VVCSVRLWVQEMMLAAVVSATRSVEAGGVFRLDNKHSTDVETPPSPPSVCM